MLKITFPRSIIWLNRSSRHYEIADVVTCYKKTLKNCLYF
jgi:hypothetical protein